MNKNLEIHNKLSIYLKFEGITKKQDLARAFLELYPLGYFMPQDNCDSFISYWKHAKNEPLFNSSIFEKLINMADDYFNEIN